MTDLRPLLQHSNDPFERQLLEAGRAYRAGDRTRQRTLSALGLVGGTSLLAKLAFAVGAHKVAAVGIAVVTLVGAGTATLALVSPGTGGSAAGPARVQTVSQAVRARVARVDDAAPRARTAEAVAVPEEGATTDTGAEPQKPVATGAPRRVVGVSLEAELALIDRVRQSLAEGNAGGALRELDQHSRAFPRGTLRLEAEVLRIEALSRLGRTAEARERAKTFLAARPNSVFAERLRRRFPEL